MFTSELEFLKLLEGMRSDFLVGLLEAITILGEETPIIVIICIFYFAVNKDFARRLTFIITASLSVNGALKNLIMRPRPFLTGEVSCVRPETATGSSMPSGHTQNVSTWTSIFAYKIKKWWAYILTVLLIAVVGFSRLFLGAHYPSDVAVGVVIGLTISIVLNILHDRMENKQRLYTATALVILPFAIFFVINADPLYSDFFKFYGMLAGIPLAIPIEEKFAPVSYDIPLWKKVVRVILAVSVALIVKTVLKLFSGGMPLELSLIYDFFRYAMLVISVFGLYPLLLKKIRL